MANAVDVREFRSYLQDLKATVRKEMAAGAEGETLVKAVLDSLRTQYGAWTSFERTAPHEILHMEAELNGTKRTPPPAS